MLSCSPRSRHACSSDQMGKKKENFMDRKASLSPELPVTHPYLQVSCFRQSAAPALNSHWDILTQFGAVLLNIESWNASRSNAWISLPGWTLVVLGNGYSLTASACSRRTLFVFSGFFLVALLRSKCSLLMEKTGECTNAHTYTHIWKSFLLKYSGTWWIFCFDFFTVIVFMHSISCNLEERMFFNDFGCECRI